MASGDPVQGGVSSTTAGGVERGAAASRARLAIRVAAVVAALALVGLGGRTAAGHLQEFTRWLEGIGAWGPIAFVLGYVVATVAFVPGSLLTLAAGALFGLARGTLYVFAGATAGASAAFLVSRYLARAAIERRLEGNERFAAIDRAVAREGRKIVLLLRLSPVFPFNLLNYGLGLTRVRFIDYALASVGMLPGTLLYVYYGKLAGDVASLAGGGAVRHDAGYYAVLVLGLAATVVVTTFVTRLARRALHEATGAASTDGRGEARR
ncbi:MAG: TVP38/TMEM64 family protein [Acidobacteriota bacterium]